MAQATKSRREKAPAFTVPKESEIQAAILTFLRLMGFVVWRQNTGMAMLPGRGKTLQPVKFGFPGLSDILGILPDGKFLAIEVKRPGGRVSPEQKAFIDTVAGLGAVAFVAYSPDDVDRELRAQWYIR